MLTEGAEGRIAGAGVGELGRIMGGGAIDGRENEGCGLYGGL
jgi:hypothetical protein